MLDAPMLQIRSVGGAVNDVDPRATAYAHRTQNFALSAVGRDLDLGRRGRIRTRTGSTSASTATGGRSGCTTRSRARRSSGCAG